MSAPEFRCDVADAALLDRLVAAPLPLALRAEEPERSRFRDVYLDTPDAALRRKDAECRLRFLPDGRRLLGLSLRSGPDRALERWVAEVAEADARAALSGASEPARRLAALLDPALLKPRLELEVDRRGRAALAGLFRSRTFSFLYDRVSVRSGGLVRDFFELTVRRLRKGGPPLARVQEDLERAYGVRLVSERRLERAERLLGSLEGEVVARAVGESRALAVLALHEGRLALSAEGGTLRLPYGLGAGEEAARLLMRERFGSRVGDMRLAGVAPAVGRQPAMEVWVATRVRRDAPPPAPVEWLLLEEVEARAGSPALRDPATLGALAVAWGQGYLRTEDTGRISRAPRHLTELPAPVLPASALDTRAEAPEQFLNPEVSLLDFNGRVLEMAEDASVPLLERLSYLAIVSANLDELYMVRVGALKAEARAESERLATDSGATPRRSLDGLTADEQLASIALRARRLLGRHGRATDAVLAELEAAGTRLVRWADMDEPAREEAGRLFRERVFPILTPRAVTLSPGHPTPLVPALTLVFAVVVEDEQTGPAHLTYLRLPASLPAFVETGAGRLAIEDLVRPHLALVYPGRRVEKAFLFRITRAAEIDVDEEEAGDLLQAIEESVRRRARNAVVRLEVERGMPADLRARLLRELRFEKTGEAFLLTEAEIHEGGRFLDPRALRDLAKADVPGGRFAPFTAREPLDAARSVWEQVRERDRLVHHPYDSFEATVCRFFREAARDPDVLSLRTTLYRAGDPSPVAEALCDAARAGKEVAAFVELKARFDEERNVGWVKRLEEAGVQVVYGLVGYKNHAKLALVVRREGDGVVRYVHAGTGNYNAATARFYTDFGLLTARPDVGADAQDLFNELTGSSHPPTGALRKLLVAPEVLQPAILTLVEREAAHARAGRPAGIRAKMNGLTDARVIQGLYRASQAGAPVDLVVRGLCTLRPGVTGLSERVRVISILGRFLEHARVWRFENGGAPETFLASADWRPRNLRRRVEVAVPIEEPSLASRLAGLLDLEIEDPRAWELGPHGAWLRRSGPAGALGVQDRLLAAPV